MLLQDQADYFAQLVRQERLPNNRNNSLATADPCQSAGDVAGHEDDALLRTVGQDPIGELGPIHLWQVVDQMTRRFAGMKLKLIQDELGWRAVFSDQATGIAPLEASARTPAEAICSAALAAVKRRRLSQS
jgi:hypothetical protein